MTRPFTSAHLLTGRLRVFVVVAALLGSVLVSAPAANAAAPSAPTARTPAAGASVLSPLTISWSPVSNPAGIVAYNWQVSPSSSFAPVIQQSSTGGATSDTVSGLAVGRYFWRVQAVNGAFEQGAWSAARSFRVTGAGAGQPGTPTLRPPKGGTAFHPFESITFTWTAAPGAASYVFEADKNASFPVGSTRIHFDNIPTTTTSITVGDFCGGCEQGNYVARVYAVGAGGTRGVPSAPVGFSVFYNNPLPAPPIPIAPINGATASLPITFSWTDVPNPQPQGYELQVSNSSTFGTIEDDIPLITPSNRTVLTLTAGIKYWRVRSTQGNASPTTAAVTTWSKTATFTVSAAPATVASITLTRTAPFSGEEGFGDVQLSAAAPAGGAIVRLTSSNPGALAVPASVTVPAGKAVPLSAFPYQAGQVTTATPVTVTAAFGSSSASTTITVAPPSVNSVLLTPAGISGGVPASAQVVLDGLAPPGGAVISLSSSSTVLTPPPTVTVLAGSSSAAFTIATSNVSTSTSATLTATWNGVSVQTQVTLTPGATPISLTVLPSTTTGASSGSVTGTVTIGSAAPFDQLLAVSSNNPAVLPFLSSSVTIPAFSTTGGILLIASSVTSPTVVVISVTGGGVTRTATLTVNPDGTPPPPDTLSRFTVSPTAVVGGSPATGTVTLPAAAPTGGTVVLLTSNLPGAASVPASVVVPAGATSARFTVTTFVGAGTTVQLTARNGDTILFAALGVS